MSVALKSHNYGEWPATLTCAASMALWVRSGSGAGLNEEGMSGS